jgi:hypothetical protein
MRTDHAGRTSVTVGSVPDAPRPTREPTATVDNRCRKVRAIHPKWGVPVLPTDPRPSTPDP